MKIYKGAAAKFKKRKGATLVVALIFAAMIMLIAVSYVEPIIRSYRAGVNDQKTLLAKSVADSMFEIALWESRGGGTGDVNEGCLCRKPDGSTGSCTIGSSECQDGYNYGFGKATAEWHVFGTPEIDDEHLIDIDGDGSGDWYTVPSPGSGDAGGSYCSTNEPVVNVDMMEDALDSLVGNPGAMGSAAEAFDWPCHWNKIREGETVAIPLYTDDGTTVRNPGGINGLGLERFDLRIRPACNPNFLPDDSEEFDQEICEAGGRYYVKGDMDTSGIFPTEDTDTVIVLWEIVGKDEDENGEQIILSGYDSFPYNSFFRANAINNTGNPTNQVDHPLRENSKALDNFGKDNTIYDYFDNIYQLYKPTLNLQVIHTLRDDQDNTIPYLEYQFKAPISLSSNLPVSNTSKVVRVDVMVDGGYSETLEKTIALPKPISGFVISQ